MPFLDIELEDVTLNSPNQQKRVHKKMAPEFFHEFFQTE